ncbi:TetR/AcrR family transcriptional regulator [Lactobacillus sp.]|uniref:TetR/AcrR family transcriptional regulator n=1 Tax=Lactobacillus sp. TaxID=1591 RepID=UPI0019C1624B|nr:TetR/AcrR family transcriptional regulator [Lactobacillus sp.]MBD5429934.1 TetR/AcrR family transcriptional regulator [Lactobacillus sp.]
MSPRTKLDLLKTTEELLSERKFEDITINDICEKALVTRSTFYRYFTDKYQLIEVMVKYIGERDLQYSNSDSFFNELEKMIIKNNNLIRNLNPLNQNHLNFYSDFLKIIEKGLTSYVNNDSNNKNDIIVAPIKQSTDPEAMIKFIAGGVSALLINAGNGNEYKKDIEFIKDTLEKLSSHNETNS